MALDVAIAATIDANIGYPGDRRCHPAPVGGSDTGLQSLARSWAKYPIPMALVVRQVNGYSASALVTRVGKGPSTFTR